MNEWTADMHLTCVECWSHDVVTHSRSPLEVLYVADNRRAQNCSISATVYTVG